MANSTQDSRSYGNFPNHTRNVQGTSIFDVPALTTLRQWFNSLFNRSQPTPVDSRAAGTPIDSRAAGQAPQNSRA